jgi:predicted transcriptional regulator
MKKYNAVKAVRLDKDVDAKLARIAVAMDRSVSWLIRNAVTQWVKAYKLPASAKPAQAAKTKTAKVTPIAADAAVSSEPTSITDDLGF